MTPDTMDLQQYKEAVRSLADTKDSHVFTNSGKDHAAIVLSNIFRTAKNQVRIFACNLNGDISSQDEYLRGLYFYIGRGGTISLLLEEQPPVTSKAYDAIRQYSNLYPSKVSIKRLLPEQREKLKTPNSVHFTVADDRMYRVETDTTNYLATCSFNDTDFSVTLRSLFDSFAERAEKIQ
jgi:hypothetical protein